MNSSILTTLYNTVKKKYGLSFYYFDHFTYFTTNYIFFSNPISEGFGKTCSFYKSNVACKHSSLPTPCIFLHHLFISTYMLTHFTELNIRKCTGVHQHCVMLVGRSKEPARAVTQLCSRVMRSWSRLRGHYNASALALLASQSAGGHQPGNR